MATNEDHYGEPNFQHIAPHARVNGFLTIHLIIQISRFPAQVSQHIHLYPTTEKVNKGQQKSIPLYDALLGPSDACCGPRCIKQGCLCLVEMEF